MKKACYVLSCLSAYKVLYVYSSIWWREVEVILEGSGCGGGGREAAG